MTNVINDFHEDGAPGPLSNFYPSPVTYHGATYPTVENAFQAQKIHALNWRDREAFENVTPGIAKKFGRTAELRADWEYVKIAIMRDLLRLKFAPGTELADYLLATGDALLVEGNTWGDQFWGQVNGMGENWLGGLLMMVRAELRAR